MIRSFLVAGAIATVFMTGVAVNKSQAQQGRTTGTSGLGATSSSAFGASSLGGSSMGTGLGASSLGSSGFGTSSLGGSSLGTSALGTGQSAFGQSAFGQTAVGQGALGSGYAAFGQQAGYGALGQTGTTGGLGQTRGGVGGIGGLTGTTGQTQRAGQQGNRVGTGNTGVQQNVQPQVPVRLQLAYEPPRPTAAAIVTSVQTNLQEIVAAKQLGHVQVTMDGGVTVLAGTVPSVSDRTVIEKIASMQPGVNTIRNEIVVGTDEDSNGTSGN